MIDFAEILPYIFMFIGFVTMVLVASTHIRISQTAQNVPVKQIDSPYRFNIDEDRSTLKDGVYVRFHTQIPCQLCAFWFVNIQSFYEELDSIDFRLALKENRFLKNNSIHQEIHSFESEGDYVQHLQFSDAENYLKNNNNQKRREYPLVLVFYSLIDEEFFQSPIQVATLHIKSSSSSDPPTKILSRISKLSNGQSLVLEDFYAPGAFSSVQTCAVCLTDPVTHVLLPCKHACICENCFQLMDKCPICQKLVITYFRI